MSKKVVFTFIFLLLATTTYATYFPQPDVFFEFSKGSCENGSIIANITHAGRSLKFTEVTITAERDDGPAEPVPGSWYREGYPSSNYKSPADNATGHDFASTTQFQFRSLPKIYTTGVYKIKMEWPSSSLYYDNIEFSITCPGIQCIKNDDCVLQQVCGTQKTCEWLQCGDQEYASGHRCFSRCDDQNSCTKDFYIDNRCIHTQIDGCCSSDSECDSGNCLNNECVSTIYKTVQKVNIFSRFLNWLKSF